MIRSPLLRIFVAILILILPAAVSHLTLLPQNPEQYLSQPGRDVVGYFSIDPTGTILELSYARFSRQEILNGRVPLWSPYQSLGHPFVADPTCSALFAPLNLLRIILPPLYWDVIFIVNLILGCWFIFLLARIYGLNYHASLVAGLSFVALGTTQLYIQVSSICQVATWLPLVLYGVELELLQVRSRWTWVPLVVGVFGLITGAHPTITIFSAFFLFIYVCIRAVLCKAVGTTVFGIITLCVSGFLLASVHWLPLVQYVTYHGSTFPDLSRLHFDFRHIAAFFLPFVYGQLNSSVSSTNPPVELTNYWSLGWLPPALSTFLLAGIWAVVQNKGQTKSRLVALITPAALLMLAAFGVPPFHLISKLPFINRARVYYVPVSIGFVLSMLIGLGYSHLVERRGTFSRAVISAITVLLISSALAIWVLHAGGVHLENTIIKVGRRFVQDAAWCAIPITALWMIRNERDQSRGSFLVALCAISFSAIAFFPWGSPKGMALAMQWGIVLFFVCTMLAVIRLRPPFPAWAAVSGVLLLGFAIVSVPGCLPKRRDIVPQSGYISFLQHNLKPQFRSYGMDGFLFPNFSATLGFSSVNVITGFVSPQVERFFRSFLDAYQAPEQILGINNAGVPDTSPGDQVALHRKFWNYIGVQYLVTHRPDFAQSLLRADTGIPSSFQLPPGSRVEELTEPREVVLSCHRQRVDAVCVFFGTYGKSNRGRITVRALDATRREIASSTVDSAAIRDLECRKFDFSKNICKTGEVRLLEVSYQKDAPDSSMAVFRGPGSHDIRVAATVEREPLFRLAFEDPTLQAQVWENQAALPRLYVAPEWVRVADWKAAQESFASQGDLRHTAFVEKDLGPCPSSPQAPSSRATAETLGFKLAPGRVEITTNVLTPGMLVLVDAFMPGWQADVDGLVRPSVRVNGTFLGTCINSPGTHRVVFKYEPREWMVAKLLVWFGFLMGGMIVTLRGRIMRRRSFAANR